MDVVVHVFNVCFGYVYVLYKTHIYSLHMYSTFAFNVLYMCICVMYVQ